MQIIAINTSSYKVKVNKLKNVYLFKNNPLHVNINMLMKNNYFPKQQQMEQKERQCFIFFQVSLMCDLTEDNRRFYLPLHPMGYNITCHVASEKYSTLVRMRMKKTKSYYHYYESSFDLVDP